MSNEKLREVLQSLIDIIDAAGLLNLRDGVLFNQTAWYVKASDIMIEARQALAMTEPTGMPELPEPDLYAHELLQNSGGVWLGVNEPGICELSHVPGETGEEIRSYFTLRQLKTYGEQCWKAGYEHGKSETPSE